MTEAFLLKKETPPTIPPPTTPEDKTKQNPPNTPPQTPPEKPSWQLEFEQNLPADIPGTTLEEKIVNLAKSHKGALSGMTKAQQEAVNTKKELENLNKSIADLQAKLNEKGNTNSAGLNNISGMSEEQLQKIEDETGFPVKQLKTLGMMLEAQQKILQNGFNEQIKTYLEPINNDILTKRGLATKEDYFKSNPDQYEKIKDYEPELNKKISELNLQDQNNPAKIGEVANSIILNHATDIVNKMLARPPAPPPPPPAGGSPGSSETPKFTDLQIETAKILGVDLNYKPDPNKKNGMM